MIISESEREEIIHKECLSLIDKFRGIVEKENLIKCAIILAEERTKHCCGDNHDWIRHREFYESVIEELKKY